MPLFSGGVGTVYHSDLTHALLRPTMRRWVCTMASVPWLVYHSIGAVGCSRVALEDACCRGTLLLVDFYWLTAAA